MQKLNRKLKNELYKNVSTDYDKKLSLITFDIPGLLFKKFRSIHHCTEIDLLNDNFYAFMADVGRKSADKSKSVFLFPKIVDVRHMTKFLKQFTKRYPIESKSCISKFRRYFSCELQLKKIEPNLPSLFATIAQRTIDPNRVYLQLDTAWQVYRYLRIERPLKKYGFQNSICNFNLNEFLAIIHFYSKIFPNAYGKRFSINKLVIDVNKISAIHVNPNDIYDLEHTNKFLKLWDALTIEALIRTKFDVISLQFRVENTPYENQYDRINILKDALKLSPQKRLILADKYVFFRLSTSYPKWIPDGDFWFGGNRQFVNRSTQRMNKMYT